MTYTFQNENYFAGNVARFSANLKHLAGKPCHLLEIGVFEGRATTWLLDNIATDARSSITCVDLEPQRSFAANTAGVDRITLMKGLSRDVLPRLPRRHFDFIYVDGSHQTIDVLEDAVASFRLAKVGGIIGFDDYRWNDGVVAKRGGTPKPAIDAFRRIYGEHLEVLTGWRCYQFWIRKLSEPVD